MATAADDPHLGSGPDDDNDDDDDGTSLSGSDSDSDSVLSDDSVLPSYIPKRANGGQVKTLYEACARNELGSLRSVLERGVTREEVMEVDINGWNGLMLACCKGFVDIVYGLHNCPFIEINHQDNEGNTALMIASQAGHTNTVMYLLNYFPGIDTEIRDCRGFTAFIKAAMTGRNDVVAALMMAGADIHAADAKKGKCAQDWALKTGRYDTLFRMRRLVLRPKAEQFCESYVPEWPALKEKVAKAIEEKTAREKITQRLKNTFGFRLPRDPQDNGVLDHMVRITTSVHSPLISTGCRPLCPTSPPAVGKRRYAVSELVKNHPKQDLEETSVCHTINSVSHISPSIPSSESISTQCCHTANSDRRGSILSLASTKVTSTFIPRSMARRNSIFPSGCIPQISISRPTTATPKKEKKKKKDKTYLEPPKWKYKEMREDRKREKRAEKEKEKEKGKGKEKKEKKREKDSKKSKSKS